MTIFQKSAIICILASENAGKPAILRTLLPALASKNLKKSRTNTGWLNPFFAGRVPAIHRASADSLRVTAWRIGLRVVKRWWRS